MKKEKSCCITHDSSQAHFGPKQTKAFEEVPSLGVFLLPLSVQIRNYTNIYSIFFYDYHVMLPQGACMEKLYI